MLEITLQFKSVDEAIVALGKLMAAKVQVAAEKAPVVAEKAATPAATMPKGKRKPRADAGKQRGPNARTAGDAPPEPSAAPQGNIVDENRSTLESASNGSAAIAPSVDHASPAVAAPTTEPPPQTDAEAALTAVFEQKGLVVAQEVLSRFGLKRLKDILPEQRAEFIAAAKAVLEGAQP